MTPEDPGPAPAWARLTVIGAVLLALATLTYHLWSAR